MRVRLQKKDFSIHKDAVKGQFKPLLAEISSCQASFMHFEPNIPIIHLRQLPTPSTGAQLLSLPVPSHPISWSSRQLVLAELVTSALFFN
jgi:hypothetical protein